jgi:hypothetical protein
MALGLIHPVGSTVLMVEVVADAITIVVVEVAVAPHGCTTVAPHPSTRGALVMIHLYDPLGK